MIVPKSYAQGKGGTFAYMAIQLDKLVLHEMFSGKLLAVGVWASGSYMTLCVCR